MALSDFTKKVALQCKRSTKYDPYLSGNWRRLDVVFVLSRAGEFALLPARESYYALLGGLASITVRETRQNGIIP